MSRPSPLAGVAVYVERWGELRRAYPERPDTLVPMCGLCHRLADRITIEHRPHGAARLVVFCHGAREEAQVPPGVLVPGARFTLLPAFRQLPVHAARPRVELPAGRYLPGTVVGTTVGQAPPGGSRVPTPRGDMRQRAHAILSRLESRHRPLAELDT